MKAIAINKKKKVSLGQSIILLLLSVWALTTIYPIIWVVLNSFKDRRLILSNSFALPLGEIFTLDNYRLAFERVDILSAYKNSLLISTSVAAVVILLAGLAAYVLARYEFRLKKLLYNLVIAGMMFPVFSTIIPVFQMQYSWGIVNTSNLFLSLLSTALPQIAGNLSFAIVVLMGYIKSIPIELEEAAYIEGCNIFQIFFRVIVPLTKPSFATVAIFSFLWSYNDLFTQMFFLRTKTQWAITFLLNQLTSQEGTNYGLMAAAVTLVVIPILIVYIFLQKYIIKGMTSGAIKG
jgi:raffinose/stachyose/melibiose transport system permease protein